MEVGQYWAYRRSGTGPFEEVRVQKVGTKSPPRVRVRFMDEEREGDEDWVPRGRLKGLWRDIEELRAEDRAWAALRAAGRPETPESDAQFYIFGWLIPETVMDMHGNGSDGLAEIRDLPALLEATGLDRSVVLAPPAIERKGVIYTPWPTTVLIFRAIATSHGAEVVKRAEQELEASHEQSLEFLSERGFSPGDYNWDEAEPHLERWDDRDKSGPWGVLKNWAGVDGAAAYDDAEAMRAAYVESRRLLREAVRRMSLAGRSQLTQDLIDRINEFLSLPTVWDYKGSEHPSPPPSS